MGEVFERVRVSSISSAYRVRVAELGRSMRVHEVINIKDKE